MQSKYGGEWKQIKSRRHSLTSRLVSGKLIVPLSLGPYQFLKLQNRGKVKENIGNGKHKAVRFKEKKYMIRWLVDRDENIKFFHGVLKNKNRKNNIHGLLIDGSVTT